MNSDDAFPWLAGALNPSRTALLIIDAQQDFIGPDGLMAQIGCDLSAIPPALKMIDDAIAAARTARAPIVFARVISRPQTDSRALLNFMERRGFGVEGAAICRAGTDGADYFHVHPQPGDIEIEKPLYSAFVGTDLAQTLGPRGIDTLVLAGFSTNCCVENTARDGFHRDFNIFVLEDACADYATSAHDASLAAMAEQCAIMISTRMLRHIWSL